MSAKWKAPGKDKTPSQIYREAMRQKARIGLETQRSKFGNQKTEAEIGDAGYSFDSQLERGTYRELRLLESAGEIRIRGVQSHVYLTDARVDYIADFECEYAATGVPFWVEAKGFETASWRIKRRLWTVYGPGELWIYRDRGGRPVRTEVIRPRSNVKMREKGE